MKLSTQDNETFIIPHQEYHGMERGKLIGVREGWLQHQ